MLLTKWLQLMNLAYDTSERKEHRAWYTPPLSINSSCHFLTSISIFEAGLQYIPWHQAWVTAHLPI